MGNEEPETTALAELSGADDTVEDLTWASLEIQRSQRQIARGVSELAEGIVSLSLVLLEVRRRRLYRFDPDYPTFEEFVARRHGISADQAGVYVEALANLGEAQYRALVADIGLQRTYALAMLKKADPTLVVAFQMLPAEERRAVTVAQIEAVDAAVTADLRTRVSQLEQEITREHGLLQQTRRRLQEVEELHQRVTGSLIEERDGARQALDQEQSQTERLRKLLVEARRQGTEPRSASKTVPAEPAAPAPTAVSEPPDVAEAVVVVVACDVPGILTDVRGLVEKLDRLAQLDRDDIPAEHRRTLARALQELNRTLHTLLNG